MLIFHIAIGIFVGLVFLSIFIAIAENFSTIAPLMLGIFALLVVVALLIIGIVKWQKAFIGIAGIALLAYAIVIPIFCAFMYKKKPEWFLKLYGRRGLDVEKK